MASFRNLVFIFGAVFLFLWGCSSKQASIPGHVYHVGKGTSYFVTPEDIPVHKLDDKAFKDVEAHHPILPSTSDYVWLRIRVPPVSEAFGERGILEVGYPLLDRVHLFLPDSSQNWQEFKSGSAYNFDERHVKNREVAFHVPGYPDSSYVAYARIKTTSSMAFRLILRSEEAHKNFTEYRNLFYGLILGAVLFAALYNLVIFLAVRDIAYLFYVFSAIFYCIVILFLNGLISQYDFFGFGERVDTWHKVFISVSMFFALGFARFFLKTKETLPGAHRVLQFLAAFSLISVPLVLLFESLGNGVLVFLYIIVTIFLFWLGLTTYREGVKEARFFILAPSTSLILFLINFLIPLGLVPYTYFVTDLQYWGVDTDTFLLSIALADRINLLNKERIKEREQRIVEERKAKEADLKAQAAELQANLIEQESARKAKELETARQLQESMLPKIPVFKTGLDIGVFYQSATEVGDDYYDFFELNGDRWMAVIGDATGHGLGAGLMVTITKTALSFIDAATPTKLLNRMNLGIQKLRPERLNMALTVMCFSKYDIEFSNAGMPPLLHVKHKLGKVHENLLPGLPLGAMSKAKFSEATLRLEPGDCLLAQSDGLIEMQNEQGEEFGYERIHHILLRERDKSPEQIIDALIDAGMRFKGETPLDDDLTLILIKRDPVLTHDQYV